MNVLYTSLTESYWGYQKTNGYIFCPSWFLPRCLITDFDTKLIGGSAREHLNSLKIHVNAAAAHRQDQNGLAECQRQTMILMARNWLASAELPTKFCFFAVKRMTEICNYFPFQLEDGTWTTLLQSAHDVKPDLRVLFKLFGLAAIKRARDGDSRLGKFESQSIPIIAVGQCLKFYNLANGTFVSSIDYHFQNNVTSGSYFGLKYQQGTFIYHLDESTSVFAPKFVLDTQVYVHTYSPPLTATVIGIPTYRSPDIYTVLF